MPHLAPPIWAPGINLSHPLAQGLALALPMWEGDGTTASDYSGDGRDAALTSMGKANWLPTPAGYSLDFDGSADYGNVGSAAAMLAGYTEPETVSFWIKTSTASNTLRAVLGYVNPAGTKIWAIHIERDAANKIEFFLRSAAGTDLRVGTATAVNDGAWHRVVFTRSSNAAADTQFYVDGIAATTASVSDNSPSTTHDAVDIYLGARNFSGVNLPLACQLRDVRYYRRALTAAEVAADYADPWAIYRPAERWPLWVAATSGGAAPATDKTPWHLMIQGAA